MGPTGKASAIPVEWHQPSHLLHFLYELAVSEWTFPRAHETQLQRNIKYPDPEEGLRKEGVFWKRTQKRHSWAWQKN